MRTLLGFLLAALSVTGFAMTAYFTPVIAMGMGIAFLGDGVTGLQWLGTAFIVGSAVIETRGEVMILSRAVLA